MGEQEKITELGMQLFGDKKELSLDQYPEVIEKSFEIIKKIDEKCLIAEQNAAEANDEVTKVAGHASNAKMAANRAKDTAERLSNSSGGFWQRKATIENIRDSHIQSSKAQNDMAKSMIEITEAQSKLALAQEDTVEAMKMSFEFNKEIINVTKFLFCMGATSITASQSVCRAIEMKLSNASEEELSEFSRRELQSVVQSLRTQESIMTKQEELSIFVDEIVAQVNENTELLDQIVESLKKNERKDDEQDVKLKAQQKKDIEHDRLLAEGKEHDEVQDAKLEAQEQKDIEHDRLLAEGKEHDEVQDAKLEAQEEKDIEHDRLLAEGKAHDKEQDNRLNELQGKIHTLEDLFSSQADEMEKTKHLIISKKVIIGSYICGGIGIIMGILGLVL